MLGPSGHGKTELAKQMGSLLSLPLCKIDCTEMIYKTDLFGPKAPYFGSSDGSLMNNFLCTNKGKRCIVFLDEFEKCGKDVHEALLLPFDEGRSQLWTFPLATSDNVCKVHTGTSVNPPMKHWTAPRSSGSSQRTVPTMRSKDITPAMRSSSPNHSISLTRSVMY
jgi:hypothetical protein